MKIKAKQAIAIVALAVGYLAAPLVGAQGRMLQIKGSDTMVNLIQVLAEEFMARNPKSPVAVLGGGSGTGITALINGTTAIANHSREMNQKEINQAWEKGVNPRNFAVAIDGLSIIVNAGNPLEKLTMAQVGAIYRGEIKNWKAVGGPDKAISLYGRQSNSGTYTFLLEHVLGNKPYSTDMKEMNGNSQIIEGVIQDEGAVGYVGVGYIVESGTGKVRSGLKVLLISKNDQTPPYSPLDKARVDSGDYPISRPLYMSTNGKPTGTAAEILKFICSAEGQKIVEREGFYTVGGKYASQNEKNFK